MVAVVIGFLLVGVAVAVVVVWLLVTTIWGSEHIVVGPDRLAIRNRPIGRLREYLLHEVRDLRVQPAGHWVRWMRSQPGSAYRRGTIAFDYGARTFSFGYGLNDAEAKQLVSVINERFGHVMQG